MFLFRELWAWIGAAQGSASEVQAVVGKKRAAGWAGRVGNSRVTVGSGAEFLSRTSGAVDFWVGVPSLLLLLYVRIVYGRQISEETQWRCGLGLSRVERSGGPSGDDAVPQ